MRTTVLVDTDAAYPASLRALAPPPPIYVRGALPTLPGVAVVGTRRASDESLAFARDLARDLVGLGFAVWSGGALGVDAAAHEGALDAGGVTVVVTGGGLDRPYPPEHVELFRRVLAHGGALVARVSDEVPPMPARFLMRNAVLAAMTLATVVVQAGLASGARSTASAARRFGRPLCVVPHPPWDPGGAGCALELAAGALAITRAADVADAIRRASGAPPLTPLRGRRREPRSGPPGALTLPMPMSSPVVATPPPGASPVRQLTDIERWIVETLTQGPVHVEEICERCDAGFGAVSAALLTLTLDAVVVEAPSGFYRRLSG